MNDGARVYPVEYFFLHHAVSDRMTNWSDLQVQDWFSNVGKARGYANGTINSYHEHPSRKGQQTYAMAQFCLRPYTKDGNKYGYRLTDLIKNPWSQVAWHCGVWYYNQRSCGVEVAGDFRNYELPDKALMCLADYLRPIDKNELGGKLKIWLHREVFATECPARIANQRNKLVDMINNPAKWNKALWPPKPEPKPEPKPTPKPDPVTQVKKTTFSPAKIFKVTKETTLVNIPANTTYNTDKYKVGQQILDVVELLEYSDGKKFYRTKYARDTAKKMYGFGASTLVEVVPPVEPEPEVPVEPEPPIEPPVTPPVEPPVDPPVEPEPPVEPPVEPEKPEEPKEESLWSKLWRALAEFFSGLAGRK